MTCHGSICFDFIALLGRQYKHKHSLFCRAMSVYCLSRVHACAIKSKQTPHLYKIIVYYDIPLCRILA